MSKALGSSLTANEEEVLAYIEAETDGTTIEQIIRDLEIVGRLLPDIMQSLLEKGLLRMRDNRYFAAKG
ncbi:MAG: hypothetical protein HYV63_11660 [Candidatus Schekmanbacteria bacterium]|nr:hypothetical protein [Candidatus Schekmanbacteria bacterium]